MVRPVKIDTSKLELLPVPEGLSVRYKHMYKEIWPKPNTPEYARMLNVGLDKFKPTKHLIATTATLVDKENGEFVSTAMSTVARNDVPNKKLGRTIAHNRAVKQWEKMVKAAKNDAMFVPVN